MNVIKVRLRVKESEKAYVGRAWGDAVLAGWSVYCQADETGKAALLRHALQVAKRGRRSREAKSEVSFTMESEIYDQMLLTFAGSLVGPMRFIAFMPRYRPSKPLEFKSTQWRIILVSTQVCASLSEALPSIKLADQVPTALQVWDALPEHARLNALRAPEAKGDGRVQLKLPIESWAALKKIGAGNQSRGARIVLQAMLGAAG